MIRPVKTFDMQGQTNIGYDLDRKPLIQLEPACFYKEENNLDNHSSIPQGVELKRKVVIENNVELSDFERKLQKIGIIPSESWIQGKSKNLWVNLAKNIFDETFGIQPEDEIDDTADYIIDLPTEDLCKVDDLEPQYTKVESTKKCDAKAATVIDINYDLFYSDVDESELDAAPSVCEIYK